MHVDISVCVRQTNRSLFEQNANMVAIIANNEADKFYKQPAYIDPMKTNLNTLSLFGNCGIIFVGGHSKCMFELGDNLL